VVTCAPAGSAFLDARTSGRISHSAP
jgi:hypothetical protein